MVFLVNIHLFPGRVEINVRKRSKKKKKKKKKERKIERRERNGQQFCNLIVNNEERRPTFEENNSRFFFFLSLSFSLSFWRRTFGVHLTRRGSTLYSGLVVSLFGVNYTLNTRQGKVFHLPPEFRLFENTFTSAVSGKRDPHTLSGFVHSLDLDELAYNTSACWALLDFRSYLWLCCFLLRYTLLPSVFPYFAIYITLHHVHRLTLFHFSP